MAADPAKIAALKPAYYSVLIRMSHCSLLSLHAAQAEISLYDKHMLAVRCDASSCLRHKRAIPRQARGDDYSGQGEIYVQLKAINLFHFFAIFERFVFGLAILCQPDAKRRRTIVTRGIVFDPDPVVPCLSTQHIILRWYQNK